MSSQSRVGCFSRVARVAMVCSLLLSAQLYACDAGGGEGAASASGSDVPTLLTVIDVLGFSRETSPGVAPGFDLDERISEHGDSESCGHGDFVSPEGDEGVDNQLALITPLFDTVGIGAIETFVQAAVDEGGLLLMWELSGVDDLANDEEVTLRLRFGSGTPLLGTDGVLLSGQTFHLHPESPNQALPNARIVDGRLEAGPADLGLPIVVFEVQYILDIRDARIRADVTFDGGLAAGVLGGRVSIDNLMEIAERAEMESGGIIEAVTAILTGMGDQSPDENGDCQEMSAALTFSAVSAYLFGDAPARD